MGDTLFEEYKSAYGTLNEELGDASEMQLLVDAYKTVIKTSNIGREEGLIMLDHFATNMEIRSTLDKFFQEILMLIIDGTDPALIEEIGRYRLVSYDLKGVQEIAGLMYLRGALSVQAGENPRVIEVKLKTMIPLRWSSYFEQLEGSSFSQF